MLAKRSLNQFCYIPHLPLWLSIFIRTSVDCQKVELLTTKQNIVPSFPFYENSTHFNYRISMDTKGPISALSDRNQNTFVIIAAFSPSIKCILPRTFFQNTQFKTLSINEPETTPIALTYPLVPNTTILISIHLVHPLCRSQIALQFLAFREARLENCSNVQKCISSQIISHISELETKLRNPFPLNSFVIHKNAKSFHFCCNPKSILIGLRKRSSPLWCKMWYTFSRRLQFSHWEKSQYTILSHRTF